MTYPKEAQTRKCRHFNILAGVSTDSNHINQTVRKVISARKQEAREKAKPMKKGKLFGKTLFERVDFQFLLYIILILACNNTENKPRDEITENNGKQIIKMYGEREKLNKEYEINVKGQIDGYYKEYYQNGNMKNFYRYHKGVLHGVQKRYYENGNLWSISYYKNSVIDSIQKWYYLNGPIKSEFFWIDGKRFGIQKEYNQEGMMESMYFISPSCDSCMTLALDFNREGKIIHKNGNLVTCIYSQERVSSNDTIKALFYVTVPDSYRYLCKFIQKEESGYRLVQAVKLSNFNNNRAFLFMDRLKVTGKYKLGVSVELLSTDSKNTVLDSAFLPITVGGNVSR